jgi:hypothetical protein
MILTGMVLFLDEFNRHSLIFRGTVLFLDDCNGHSLVLIGPGYFPVFPRFKVIPVGLRPPGNRVVEQTVFPDLGSLKFLLSGLCFRSGGALPIFGSRISPPCFSGMKSENEKRKSFQ